MRDVRVRYGNFFAPSFQIKINGKNVCTDINVAIPGVTVSLGCGNEANSCTFSVGNLFDIKNRKFRDELDTYFKPTNVVEVSAGYIKNMLIFKGVISSLSYTYGSDGAPSVDVECMDMKSVMMADQKYMAYKENKYSEVIKKVLEHYKSSKAFKTINVQPLKNDKQVSIEKEATSDYEFLCSIASKAGYEFFVQGDTVYFQESMKNTSELINLEFGVDLISFRTSRRMPGQVFGVKARNISQETTGAIQYLATVENTSFGNLRNPEELTKIPKDVVKVIVDPKIRTESDAQVLAEATLREIVMNYVSCSGSCVGFPEFVPGRFIKISKLGLNPENENVFYIVRVEHSIDSSGYGVSFEGRMNAV